MDVNLSVISMKNVSKYYGRFLAIDKVNINVRKGEIMGLIGPNGAGKTTILNIAAGLIAPSSGEVFILDQSIQKYPFATRAKVGFSTNEMKLYPKLTPRETLFYFGKLFSVSPTRLKNRVENLIHQFDLTSFADRYCGTLSTGQFQRVSLARVLINDPQIVILDEPTIGLDIMSKGLLLEVIMDLAKNKNKSVLFSTHSLEEVDSLCDKVTVVANNSLLFTGNKADILTITKQKSLSEAFHYLLKTNKNEN